MNVLNHLNFFPKQRPTAKASNSELSELNPVADVARILGQTLTFVEKCEQMLGILARALGADFATLREPNAEATSMDLIAYYKEPLAVHVEFPQSIAIHNLTAEYETSPTVINDASKVSQPLVPDIVSLRKSAIVAPIHQDGVVIGRLGFGSSELNHFDDDDKPMLENIAGTFGVLMQNARLLEHREIEADIGRIIGSSLDIPEALASFTDEARKILGFDRLVMSSISEPDETYVTEFVFGDDVEAHQVSTARSYMGTLVEQVAKTRRSQLLNLSHNDQELNRQLSGLDRLSIFVESGYRFFISTPLVAGDKLVGTLAIMRKTSRFTPDELIATERLGNLVAGALASFKLEEYKRQAEKDLQKSKAILEVEANIGRILSSPLGGVEYFEALKSALATIIPLDRVVLAAVDVETGQYSQGFNEFLSNPESLAVSNFVGSYKGTITSEVVKSGVTQILNADDPRLESGQFPRAMPLFDRGYRSLLATPMSFENTIIGTIVFARLDGEYDHEDAEVANRIGSLLAGALATFKITEERNRALLALSESEGRFRQIADTVGSVFSLVELDSLNQGSLRLIYASPNFVDLWGISAEEAFGNPSLWMQSVHPDDLDRVSKIGLQTANNGNFDIEYRIIGRSGEVKWIRSCGFPVRDENGKLFRISGITEDITEKKSELERIAEAGRLLSVGELASGVAHEINNPLACINLYSEMLMEQDLPDTVIEDLQVISNQGKRAALIVRNLLQFARKSSPTTTTVSARDLVEHCIDLKAHDFRVNNVTATTDVPKDLQDIAIDEHLMTQVLVNLLSNAEQACVSAHGRGQISVIVREANDSILISVSDDGPGILPEVLPQIFTPFFTTKGVGDGTGLGLSVSYGIVAQMGGRLWAESNGRTGSAFHIEIPQGGAVEQPDLIPDNQTSQDEIVSPVNILVVDDEQNLRDILARLLERPNCKVDRAADGDEAWSKIQSVKYDCILLDLRMPGTDGQALFGRIRESDPELANKIVFITGDIANSKTRSFLSGESNHVLEKPLDISNLHRTVISVARGNPEFKVQGDNASGIGLKSQNPS